MRKKRTITVYRTLVSGQGITFREGDVYKKVKKYK